MTPARMLLFSSFRPLIKYAKLTQLWSVWLSKLSNQNYAAFFAAKCKGDKRFSYFLFSLFAGENEIIRRSLVVVLTLSKRVIRNTPPFVCGLVKSLGSVKFLLGQLDLLMFQRSFAVSRCSFDPPIPPRGLSYCFFLSCLFSINSVLPQTLSVCFLFVFSN